MRLSNLTVEDALDGHNNIRALCHPVYQSLARKETFDGHLIVVYRLLLVPGTQHSLM
jgi:hypothetical protein